MANQTLLTEADEKLFYSYGYKIELERIVKTKGFITSLTSKNEDDLVIVDSVIYNIYNSNNVAIYVGIESDELLVDSILRLIA